MLSPHFHTVNGFLRHFSNFPPDQAPTRAERAPVRTHARAHTISLLFRTARQIFPRALHSNAERSRTSSFSAHVSTRCPQALSASATHLTREKAAGAENTCAKPQADQHDLVRSTKSCPTAYGMFLRRMIIVNFCTCSGYSGHRRKTRRDMPAGIRKKTGHKRFTNLAR